jgi:dTDP-4-amino-4,6-dideoxygalactose transaminase
LCYPLLVEDNRQVMEQLVSRGIEAVDFWREGHPACERAAFPDVARLRTSVLELPCHQDLSLETLAEVVAVVREVLDAQPAPVAGTAHHPGRSAPLSVAS